MEEPWRATRSGSIRGSRAFFEDKDENKRPRQLEGKIVHSWSNWADAYGDEGANLSNITKAAPNPTHENQYPAFSGMISDITGNLTSNSDINSDITINSNNDNDTTPVMIMALPVLFLCLFCALCCSGRGAGARYHRGEQIREQAERIWAAERRRAKRQECSHTERLAAIHRRLSTMTVVGKQKRKAQAQGGERGGKVAYVVCELGVLESSVGTDCSREGSRGSASIVTSNNESTPTSTPTPTPTPTSEAMAMAMAIRSKRSTDTSDTYPLESENWYDDDDDEYVCHICLDGFEVGDRVMFRNQKPYTPCSDPNGCSCTHVFHETCLLQWLLEKRENECPSCREPMIDEDDESDNDKNDNDNDNDGGDATHNDAASDDGPENDTERSAGARDQGDQSPPLVEEIQIDPLEGSRAVHSSFFIVQGRIVVVEPTTWTTKRKGPISPTNFTSSSLSLLSHHPPSRPSVAWPVTHEGPNKITRLATAGNEDEKQQQQQQQQLHATSDILASSGSLFHPLPLKRVSQSLDPAVFGTEKRQQTLTNAMNDGGISSASFHGIRRTHKSIFMLDQCSCNSNNNSIFPHGSSSDREEEEEEEEDDPIVGIEIHNKNRALPYAERVSSIFAIK